MASGDTLSILEYDGIEYELEDSTARSELGNKLNNSGWSTNKYLGTDNNGNIIEKDPPDGATGISSDLRLALINFYTHVITNFDTADGMSYVNNILIALGAEPRGDGGSSGGDNEGDDTHTHTYTSSITTAPTCTTEGIRTYTCSSCGDTYSASIPATGHTYVDGVCSVCGAADPNYSAGETTEPVYTLAEATTFIGDGTDKIDTGVQLWNSLDSKWSITITTNLGDFNYIRQDIIDCGKQGEFDLFQYSVAANGYYNARFRGTGINSNTTYSWKDQNVKSVLIKISTTVVRMYYVSNGEIQYIDITAAGNISATANTVQIGTSFKGTIEDLSIYNRELTASEIEAYLLQSDHVHEYVSSVTTEATCETAGVRTYTCSSCGGSYTEEIPATGHTYVSSVTTEATCETAGVRTYTCSSCGGSYTEEIPATGHTYVDDVCSVCGAADPNYSAGETTEPVYTLVEATTFIGDGTDKIEVDLGSALDISGNWSVVITAALNGFNWKRQSICLIDGRDSSVTTSNAYVEYAVTASGYYALRVSQSSINENGFYTRDAQNPKTVITHEAGSSTATAYYISSDNEMALLSVKSGTGSFSAAASKVVIGDLFNGTISDLKIYARKLTEEEIRGYLFSEEVSS